MAHRRWIKGAVRAPGALHRMMGVPAGEPLSEAVVRGWRFVARWVVHVHKKPFHGHSVAWWKKAGRRASVALTARTFKHKRKRRHRR